MVTSTSKLLIYQTFVVSRFLRLQTTHSVRPQSYGAQKNPVFIGLKSLVIANVLQHGYLEDYLLKVLNLLLHPITVFLQRETMLALKYE